MANTVSPSKRRRVFERDEYRCRYCMKDGKATGDISIDHVIPKSRGGTNDLKNLVTACYQCNNIIKHDKTLDECGLELIKI
jgi:5-methylcytosine-specific restriction endonuclease McrA